MIVLVNPFTRRGNDTYLPQWEVCEHLGIASLLGALRRAGITCSVVNSYLREYSQKETVQAVLAKDPSLVGISLLNENYAWAREVLRELKELRPDLPTVVGGYFPTIIGEKLLRHNADIDYLIKGEGEGPLVALAQCLASKGDLANVPGLSYRKGERIASNSPSAVSLSLDELAFPERDDAGLAIDILRRAGASPAIRMMTSRGCSYRCSFCNIAEYSAMVDGGRRRVRAHSPGYVCDQMEAAISRFGVNTFVISDDIFMDRSPGSKARAEEFLDELDRRELRINFACQFRLDAFDRKIFQRMLDHGLVAVAFGVESIVQDTLDFLVKDTTNAVMLNALDELSDFADRVNISLYMLVYHPFTTMDEVHSNYEFLRSIGYLDVDSEGAITRKMLTTELQVFRGGRLETQLASLGLLPGYDPDALEPAVLPFRYLDVRVPEFINAVQQDRRDSDRPVREIFEKRLAEFLSKPGPSRDEAASWRAGLRYEVPQITRLRRGQSA